jgi:hypothetical protein
MVKISGSIPPKSELIAITGQVQGVEKHSEFVVGWASPTGPLPVGDAHPTELLRLFVRGP